MRKKDKINKYQLFTFIKWAEKSLKKNYNAELEEQIKVCKECYNKMFNGSL